MRVETDPLPLPVAVDDLGLGQVEAGLELDQQTGRRLAADARDEGEGVEIALQQHPPELVGRVDREDGQGQRRSDAVGRDQRLEAVALVAGGEAVEGQGVLPDLERRVEQGGGAGFAHGHRHGGERGGRHHDPVADPSHLDQHLTPQRAVDDTAPQRPDHRASFAFRRARSGSPARWQRARARASAASGGVGRSVRLSNVCTMRWTCSFGAEP